MQKVRLQTKKLKNRSINNLKFDENGLSEEFNLEGNEAKIDWFIRKYACLIVEHTKEKKKWKKEKDELKEEIDYEIEKNKQDKEIE